MMTYDRLAELHHSAKVIGDAFVVNELCGEVYRLRTELDRLKEMIDGEGQKGPAYRVLKMDKEALEVRTENADLKLRLENEEKMSTQFQKKLVDCCRDSVDLKRRLAVYEDGKPCKDYLEWFLDEQGVWMLGEQEYRQSIEWLKRIAALDEVQK